MDAMGFLGGWFGNLHFLAPKKSLNAYTSSHNHFLSQKWVYLQQKNRYLSKNFAIFSTKKTHGFMLVGGFNPSEKYYIVKLDHFPKNLDENSKNI